MTAYAGMRDGPNVGGAHRGSNGARWAARAGQGVRLLERRYEPYRVKESDPLERSSPHPLADPPRVSPTGVLEAESLVEARRLGAMERRGEHEPVGAAIGRPAFDGADERASDAASRACRGARRAR